MEQKGAGSKRRRADKRPTLVDVARIAGVSLGTASRVLNGSTDVKPLNVAKVKKAMKSLNYRPSDVARSMRTNTSRMIGCMITDITQPVSGEMVGGAEEVLWQSGYALIVAATHQIAEREHKILDLFARHKLDGMILCTTSDADNLAIPDELADFPLVLWERDGGTRFDMVLTEHGRGTELATNHLLGLGHKRIALVAGYNGTWPGREQVRGYRNAMSAAGLAVPKNAIHETGSFDLGRAYELLERADRPTAVILNVNDAAFFLQAARTLRLRVPDDVSVVSIGDNPELDVFSPSVTAVRGNGRKVGSEAARLLLERIQHAPPASRRVFVSTELIVRQSTAAPPR